MIDELKPCPFCGERLEEVEQGSEYFRHSNNGCFFSWHEFDMGGHSSMAKNWNRRARAIPEGHVVMPGWMPIETYQKHEFDQASWWRNGERFLACHGDYVFIASYGYTQKGKGRFQNAMGICHPTHWMPLPAAPANKEG